MRVLLQSVVFATLLLVSFASCDKYPNGPSFSLRTKKARLCNEWVLTSYQINGSEFIQSQPDVKMAIDKDDTYSISSSSTLLGQIQSEFEHGTWTLEAEGTKLVILLDGEEFPSEYTINELRNNSLSLQYYNPTNNKTYVMGYSSASN